MMETKEKDEYDKLGLDKQNNTKRYFMITQNEVLLIKKFVVKHKQERYLSFLNQGKTRQKFINELYHFKDFNWKLFQEIHGGESVSDIILNKVNGRMNVTTCYVLSANFELDAKIVSVHEAIKNAVGEEGTILIFGEAEVIYYEGEAPKRRYISI